MSDAYRTVGNPGTGETITFLETSEESGGARVVALITLAPGGAVTPHSHRIRETFECVEGAFTVHLEGRDMRFPPGESMVADPQQLHGFRNDTDVAATLKVTATPAGDLDRVLRTLCGLGRDGVLVPGKPPRHPLVMANLAYRGRCYSPPLPRWLYWTLIGGMSPFGARACDRIMARYNPAPAQTSPTGRCPANTRGRGHASRHRHPMTSRSNGSRRALVRRSGTSPRQPSRHLAAVTIGTAATCDRNGGFACMRTRGPRLIPGVPGSLVGVSLISCQEWLWPGGVAGRAGRMALARLGRAAGGRGLVPPSPAGRCFLSRLRLRSWETRFRRSPTPWKLVCGPWTVA